MSALKTLAEDVVKDGQVDAAEVARIQEVLYADGIIDKGEVDMLFDINSAVSGATNDAGWEKLFVKAVTDYVLQDETTPGEVSADEAAYLIEKIGEDGKVDEVEKTLVKNIVSKATKCHQSLVDFAAKL